MQIVATTQWIKIQLGKGHPMAFAFGVWWNWPEGGQLRHAIKYRRFNECMIGTSNKGKWFVLTP